MRPAPEVEPITPRPREVEGEVIPAQRGERVHDYEGFDEDVRIDERLDRPYGRKPIDVEPDRPAPRGRRRVGSETERGPFGTKEQGEVVIVGRRPRRPDVTIGGVGVKRVPRGRVIVTTPKPIETKRPLPPTPPAPVPVPPIPKIELPPQAPPREEIPPSTPEISTTPTPAPSSGAPAPSTGPSTPSPAKLPSPGSAPAGLPAALIAAGLGLLIRSRTRTRTRTRTRATPAPAPVPTPVSLPEPTISPAPAPAPAPSSAPPSTPTPTLTPVSTAGVGSRCTPDAEACKRAKEQRKREKDAKCKAFIKVPVRAHKKSVCVQDLAKYLLRKFKSKATRELRKELKRRGVELVRRPRRPKLPDIELGGGVEIDLGDLLGK